MYLKDIYLIKLPLDVLNKIYKEVCDYYKSKILHKYKFRLFKIAKLKHELTSLIQFYIKYNNISNAFIMYWFISPSRELKNVKTYDKLIKANRLLQGHSDKEYWKDIINLMYNGFSLETSNYHLFDTLLNDYINNLIKLDALYYKDEDFN